jgi:hypothetical protein
MKQRKMDRFRVSEFELNFIDIHVSANLYTEFSAEACVAVSRVGTDDDDNSSNNNWA